MSKRKADSLEDRVNHRIQKVSRGLAKLPRKRVGLTAHERDLRRATRALVRASHCLSAAIEGVTDQFDPEMRRLVKATRDAESSLGG